MHYQKAGTKKGLWILAGVVLALMLAVNPAFADGEEPAEAPAAAEAATENETPAADAPTAESVPLAAEPDGEIVTTEEAPAADAAEEAAVEEEPTPAAGEEETSAPVADAPQTEEAPAEADEVETGEAETESIPQALAEAELVMADANGEAVDMASVESEQVMRSADPYFFIGTTKFAFVYDGDPCPDGTTLGSTCWKSGTPLTDALAYIAAGNLPTNRMLYVEAGDYAGFSLDASTSPTLGLMNGVIGVDGSSQITINGEIYISDNVGGFTLSGFTVNGDVVFWGNSGNLVLSDLNVSNSSDTGIAVYNHIGNVEMRNVNSSGNDGDGAYVSTTNGTVKVTNSAFDDNGTTANDMPENGLVISTNKAITLEGVSASRNLGNGIEISGFSALTIKNTLANHNEDQNYNLEWGSPVFIYNQSGYGIKADSWGTAAPVTLENVYANYNGLKGIDISTMGNLKAKNVEAQYNTIRTGSILYDATVWVCEGNDPCTEETKTMKRISEFLSDDVDYDEWRFTLDSEINVVIELGAYNSFAPQVCLWDGSTETCADGGEYGSFAQLNDTLVAGTYFIRVYSYNGGESGPYDLSVNWADDYDEMAWLDTGGMSFNDFDGKGTVRLENGLFHHNGGDGLWILNNNTVYLSSITTTDNGGDGIYVQKIKPIFDGSGMLTGFGAAGTVTLTSPKVTGGLTGNLANGNGGYGVNIYSKGNILISNIDASYNGSNGMYLNTCLAFGGGEACMGAGSVTVNVTIPHWANGVTDNGYMGLDVRSAGNTRIEKTWADANGYTGLMVDSRGTIYLAGTSASWNGDYGAYLTTLNAPAARTVTMVDSNFDGNNNTGLKVLTAGAINVQGSSASWNLSPEYHDWDGSAVRVFDQLYEGQSSDTYWFSGSQWDAFDAELSADFNALLSLYDSSGTLLAEDDGSGSSYAHIAGFALPADDWYRLEVADSGGSGFGAYDLKLKWPNSDDPVLFPGSGMDLDNTAGTAGVTFKNTSDNPIMDANDNANMGVKIISNGAVSMSAMMANGNYRSGLSVETTKAVTVQDSAKVPSSTFDGNGWSGIYVRTLSNIKLYGVSASYNYEGVNLDNCMFDGDLDVCTGKGSILIGNKTNVMSYFNNNATTGISAKANGTITLVNTSAIENEENGVLLSNSFTGVSAGVTVKTAGAVVNDFSGNWRRGLSVWSNGAIAVSSTSANNNASMNYDSAFDGIYLDNSRASAAKTVTLSNVSANGNGFGASGIYVQSLGNITLMNVETNDNGSTGTYLNNRYDGFAGNVMIKFSKGSTNTFSGNNGKGLEILSNGTVTVGNLAVHDNYLKEYYMGDIMSTSDTRAYHEYYNEGITEYWRFYAEPGTYDFYLRASNVLDPFGFDAYLELYKENDVPGTDVPLAFNDDMIGSDAYFQYTVTEAGYYFLNVSSAQENMNGFFMLGVNINPTWDNTEKIWNNGVAILAGKNVILNGSQRNEFTNNSLVGIGIDTPGNVTLQWFRASYNGSEGVYVDTSAGMGNVILQGANSSNNSFVSGNGWDGIVVKTNGKTTINHLWVYYSGMDGINISGGDGMAAGNNVAVNNVTIEGNTFYGLHVVTGGSFSAKKLSSQGNGYLGAYINTSWGNGAVSISNDSFFSHNGWNDAPEDWERGGLYVFSGNHITLNKVIANGNYYSGVTGVVDAFSPTGNITLTDVISVYNGFHGIDLQGNYAIKLTKVVSLSNGWDGMGFPQDGDGLHILSNTAIVTIKSSAFVGNLGNGIELFGNMTYQLSPDTYWFGNDTNRDGDKNLYLHTLL